jgi:hypothetical protein
MAAAGAAAALIAWGAAAPAKDRPKVPEQAAEPVRAIEACRQVSEAAARLACYDEASASLSAAVERKDVVVLDRQDIRDTRRSLFGFSLPRLPLFRGESGEEQTEITATIARASSLGMGKWQLRLEDGAVWQTTEGGGFMRDPKAGQKVVIKKGTLGNYFIRIDGQRGVRGKRES